MLIKYPLIIINIYWGITTFFIKMNIFNNQSLVNMLLIITFKLTFNRKNTSKSSTLSIMCLLPIKYQWIIENMVIEFQLIDLNKLLVAPK